MNDKQMREKDDHNSWLDREMKAEQKINERKKGGEKKKEENKGVRRREREAPVKDEGQTEEERE